MFGAFLAYVTTFAFAVLSLWWMAHHEYDAAIVAAAGFALFLIVGEIRLLAAAVERLVQRVKP